MSKTKLNYWLDLIIALAFILSAISGMILLFAGSGGYQGGRNSTFQTEIAGISHWAWSDLHTWVSLVMIAGVMVHLILHWNWIVCMTKNFLPKGRKRSPEVCPTN